MYKSVLLVLIISSSFVFAPKGVDFENKALLKELQKLNGIEHTDRHEIRVPQSFSDITFTQGKFFELAEPANCACKYIYIGRVNGCRQGGCSNPTETSLIETPEYFDYFILFDSNFSVLQVKVFNYQATHGQEITTKGWLKQFQGYNGSRNLVVGKSIDAISGATISVQSITADIQQKTQLLKKMIQ